MEFGCVLLERSARQHVAVGAHVCDHLIVPARRVEVQGAHLGDVNAEVAVHAGALDADEDAQIDRCPVRICERRKSAFGGIKAGREKTNEMFTRSFRNAQEIARGKSAARGPHPLLRNRRI